MDIILEAEKRQAGARSNLTTLRNEGKLPAVIYGFNIENTPVILDYRETAKVVQQHGQTAVFKIQLDGKQVNAVLNEVQRDALKGTVKHVDFLSIDMSEELEMEVPVTIVGVSAGVKEGGVLMQPVRDLKIKVKPTEIPETIEVDVSSLGIGDSLSVAEVRDRIPYQIASDDDDILASVTPPVVVSDDTAGQEDTDNADVKATEAPESQS
ncbi:50S ribosomal protein L25/general stress protein Ctc [Lysinibacillus yapensis]|uniref:Large ribosomal subunit protein bL25 n=1 Tax=Ureibacillus yapensis TaxID=2304605 RepID=A0A396S2S1_9BACL|nr:50S ribosomal protein L25/general stress protein Ctc [Lysinibacillus yapensis]RHW31746.1 50S ribosomal protein L25/general stress protein Ctc [Lysinibacillus yapensis]